MTTTTLSPLVSVTTEDDLVITAFARMALDAERIKRNGESARRVIQDLVSGCDEILQARIASQTSKDLAETTKAQLRKMLTDLDVILSGSGEIAESLTAVARESARAKKGPRR